MISFKQFILSEYENGEDDGGIYIPKPLTLSECVEWLKTNAPKFVEGKAAIYRGDSKYRKTIHYGGVLDTNKFNRKSANTHNYYTVFMDNNELWSAFPKRSKLVICASSRGISSGFGKVYKVFPSDSAKIGVCTDQDLWNSFPLYPVVGSADDVMYFTHETFKILDLQVGVQYKSLTYAELVTNLKTATYEMISNRFTVSDFSRHSRILKYMERNNAQDLYQLFCEVFNPEDFTVYSSAANFSNSEHSGKELWVQGECLMIDDDVTIRMIQNSQEEDVVDYLSKIIT